MSNTSEQKVEIKDLMESDPSFKDIITEVQEEGEGAEKSKKESTPDDWEVREWDAEEFLEWWRSSQYAYQELTYEEAIDLFEASEKTYRMRFRWASGEEPTPTMGVTHMIMSGYVEDTCIVSEDFRLTVRSLPAEAAQSMELGLGEFAGDRLYVGQRAINNYYTLETLSHTIVAINGEDTVTLARRRFNLDGEVSDLECRKKLIQNLPAEMIDECKLIIKEFGKRVTLMMRGGLSKN